MDNISTYSKWMDWAIRLQGIAQSGLFYTNNKYEIERYLQIRDISKEILAEHSKININKIDDFFCCEKGYCTPKLDTRAVCFLDRKILLVQEESGLWSIPGGWVDVNLSIAENVVKEAKEEAGAIVVPEFIISIQDWKKQYSSVPKNVPYQITKVFVMCSLSSVNFSPNSETLQYDFYTFDNLPNISEGKNSLKQIQMCFDAYEKWTKHQNWNTVFD